MVLCTYLEFICTFVDFVATAKDMLVLTKSPFGERSIIGDLHGSATNRTRPGAFVQAS